MTFFWSPSRVAFFSDEFRADYDAAGSWPDDAVAVSDDTWTAHIGAAPDGQMLAAVDGQPGFVAAPTAPTPTTITATAFLGRFTAPELGALVSSPATLLLMITAAAAGRIDLTDAAVMAGVNGLETAGVLAAGRAAVILTP